MLSDKGGMWHFGCFVVGAWLGFLFVFVIFLLWWFFGFFFLVRAVSALEKDLGLFCLDCLQLPGFDDHFPDDFLPQKQDHF